MASSPDVWPAAAISGDRIVDRGDDADRQAVLIVDARYANPCLVLANAAARRILTPAVAGAASFVGSPLRDWLAGPECAVIAQGLAGLSKLRPTARRTVVWPFIWGSAPTMTRFRLLDWDSGQALVMLSFSAAPSARSFALVTAPLPPVARRALQPMRAHADSVPRGVAGMSAHLSTLAQPPARMRRSEDLLRATMANTADTLLFLDTSLRVRFVNKAHAGLQPEHIVGSHFTELLPAAAREAVGARLQRLLATGEAIEYQYEAPDADRLPQHGEIRATLVRDVGVGIGVCVAIRDVTDVKRLEREILEASVVERQRIGRDLHDGLGQDLTGVALMLRALATRLERDCPSAANSATEILGLVNQSLEGARALAHGLLPVSRERGGLVGALRSLANRCREIYGLDVRCRAEIWPELQMQEDQASELYRIAQEALTNVARHAQARRVRITLHVSRRRYCLKIADDGIGIARSRHATRGMGLKIMAHRASLLGAKLTIVRNAPRGTLVRVTGAQVPSPSGV